MSKDKEKRFLFDLEDGTPVYHGDTLYPHPRYFKKAGKFVTAEFKADGDEVTVRSQNGAVPTLPINMLFIHPSPEGEVYSNLEKALKTDVWNIGKRDIAAYQAGVSSTEKQTDALQNQVNATKKLLDEFKEKSDALHSRWQVFNDSVALAEAEILDQCIQDLEKVLNPVGEQP